MERKLATFLWIAGLCISQPGCNPEDQADLKADVAKVGKTATKSLDNAQLAARVRLTLSQLKDVNVNEIRVESKSGTVTLRGQVKSKQILEQVAETTRSIKGVESVNLQLKVVVPIKQTQKN